MRKPWLGESRLRMSKNLPKWKIFSSGIVIDTFFFLFWMVIVIDTWEHSNGQFKKNWWLRSSYRVDFWDIIYSRGHQSKGKLKLHEEALKTKADWMSIKEMKTEYCNFAENKLLTTPYKERTWTMSEEDNPNRITFSMDIYATKWLPGPENSGGTGGDRSFTAKWTTCSYKYRIHNLVRKYSMTLNQRICIVQNVFPNHIL